MSKPTYRPDIDGLRAVAVIPVVLFHAGVGFVGGGFVGVDIFFVISGFLVTSIIAGEMKEGRFSIAAFYDRRVRRLLPALAVVLTFCVVAAHALFLPDHYAAFGKSLAASVAFAANFFFWQDTAYFGNTADTKPLLHLWSLAVEEQFYILFPVCLAALFRWSPRLVRPGLVVAAVLSFTISAWGAVAQPAGTFYLAPLRAWELLLGALLALGLFPLATNSWGRNAAATLGISLIAWSVLTFDDTTTFPGVNALFPCVGAALLIHAGTGGVTLVGRVLSHRVPVFVGLISYSLYLWHWPLIVFAKYWRAEPLSPLEMTAVVGLAIGLSVASWRFVESPFRGSRGIAGRRASFAAASVCILLGLGAGGWLARSDGMPGRFAAEYAAYQVAKADHVPASCSDIEPADWPVRGCGFGDPDAGSTSFLVWGDSHAYALAPALDALGRDAGAKGRLASYGACPPLLGVVAPLRGVDHRCREQNETVLGSVRPGMTVFLTARWPYYDERSVDSGEGPVYLNDAESRGVSVSENRRVLRRALERTVRALQDRGARVVVVTTVPEFPGSVPEMALRNPSRVRVSRSRVDERVRFTESVIRGVQEGTGITVVDPKDALCDEDWCHGVVEQAVLYFDDDHLSRVGARRLVHLLPSLVEADRAAAPPASPDAGRRLPASPTTSSGVGARSERKSNTLSVANNGLGDNAPVQFVER